MRMLNPRWGGGALSFSSLCAKRLLWSNALALWVSVTADLLCCSLSGYHLHYILESLIIYIVMNVTCRWLSMDGTVAGEIRKVTVLRSILVQVVYYVCTVLFIKFLGKGIRKVFFDIFSFAVLRIICEFIFAYIATFMWLKAGVNLRVIADKLNATPYWVERRDPAGSHNPYHQSHLCPSAYYPNHHHPNHHHHHHHAANAELSSLFGDCYCAVRRLYDGIWSLLLRFKAKLDALLSSGPSNLSVANPRPLSRKELAPMLAPGTVPVPYHYINYDGQQDLKDAERRESNRAVRLAICLNRKPHDQYIKDLQELMIDKPRKPESLPEPDSGIEYVVTVPPGVGPGQQFRASLGGGSGGGSGGGREVLITCLPNVKSGQ